MLSSSSRYGSPRIWVTTRRLVQHRCGYARLPPRRPCKYVRPAALFDERSDRQVSCGSPESLAPRAKMRGFAAVDDLSTIRLPHDACVCRGEVASDWCEKPVLTTRSRAASRAFSTARARYWTGLYYLLEDRSSRRPRAGVGRVSWTHRRSVRHSSESSSQLLGALSARLWKREEVERRRRRSRRTHKDGASPCRRSRRDASRRCESRRVAPACGPH